MSLILDALRKSERIRQQSLSARVSVAGSPTERARLPVPWATLIGLLLIANVIVLGVLFWRGRAPSRAAPPTPAPVAAKPEVTASAMAYRPLVRSLAAEAAAAGQTGAIAAAASSVALPATPAISAPPTGTRAASVAAPAVSMPKVTAAADNDAETAATVPALDTLPEAFQQSLPPLHLDVHVYAKNPADRFVVINMQRYTKGETLAAGPTVVAIVANGVILEYHGQEFLLPRP